MIAAWGHVISDPKSGRHKNQVLSDVVIYADRWEGRITAALGDSVNVSKESVSSLFHRPAECIDMKYGAHSGEALITVWYTQRPTWTPPPSREPGSGSGRGSCRRPTWKTSART